MAYSHERRKKLVINRPMQSRLILNMALMPAIGLAAIAIVTAIYCVGIMEDAVSMDADVPNLMPLFYMVIAFELLAGFILVYSSLRISHRVAGPTYRICKCIERIRGGDITFQVSLRNGDHLTEIRDELNLLLDYLNENPPAGAVTRSMATSQKEAKEQVAEVASATADEQV